MGLRRVVLAWGLIAALAPGMVQAQAPRIADGTAVHVRLTADLLSSQTTVGARVDLEVSQPVMLQGVVVIPGGSAAWGVVRLVRKGKTLLFDIEEARLPNGKIVMLRCSPQRTKQAKEDNIKVEIQVGRDLGAPTGTEFTAYMDQDLDVDAALEPLALPRPTTAAAAPLSQRTTQTPPPEAERVLEAAASSTPKQDTPSAPPAPAAAPPVVSAPVASPAAPVVPPAPAAQLAEYVKVGCFSDPPSADILVDGELQGSTPAILKLLPGNHQIEFRLRGYHPHSQSLSLTPGARIHTVVMTLEKQR